MEPRITKAQIAKDIKQSCITIERLGELSNQEIANLLIEHIWADFDIFSPESDLLEEAIERLKDER